MLKYSLGSDANIFSNDSEAKSIAFGPIPAELNNTVPLTSEAPFWIPELKPLDASDIPPKDEEVSRRIIVDMQQLSSGSGSGLKIFWHVDRHMVCFLCVYSLHVH